MPLFLRALPLSLVTLWHYVFVLPLVVIVSAPFTLLTLIPILGWPVALTIGTFITFAGYRCALAAAGHGNEPAFLKLLRASLIWGVINTFGAIMLMIASVGVAYALGLVGFAEPAWVPGAFAVPYAGGLAAAVYLVLLAVFTAAMAVPMTATAKASTAKARDPDPFFGFGTGVASLLVALVIWVAGLVYLGFIETILDALAQGLTYLTARVMEIPIEDPVNIDWIGLVVAVLYVLWGTCWFSATAVLAWDRKIRRKVVTETVIGQRPKTSVDDLRALRESRMPGLGGDG